LIFSTNLAGSLIIIESFCVKAKGVRFGFEILTEVHCIPFWLTISLRCYSPSLLFRYNVQSIPSLIWVNFAAVPFALISAYTPLISYAKCSAFLTIFKWLTDNHSLCFFRSATLIWSDHFQFIIWLLLLEFHYTITELILTLN